MKKAPTITQTLKKYFDFIEKSLEKVLTMRIMRVIIYSGGEERMKFREIEKIILDDGWYFKTARGSHNHYKHPTKSGKVTIPKHSGDLDPRTIKSILEQAGLK